jgi:transcriptional regulator with XRE-family HTH domain
LMQDTLARKLRVLRAERGLTLREAAAATGVDKGTLSKIERGVSHPHDITLSRLARGYGIPVEELLDEPVLLAPGKTEAPKTGRSVADSAAEGAKEVLDSVVEEAGKARDSAVEGPKTGRRSSYEPGDVIVSVPHEGGAAAEVPAELLHAAVKEAMKRLERDPNLEIGFSVHIDDERIEITLNEPTKGLRDRGDRGRSERDRSERIVRRA